MMDLKKKMQRRNHVGPRNSTLQNIDVTLAQKKLLIVKLACPQTTARKSLNYDILNEETEATEETAEEIENLIMKIQI